MSFIVQIVFFVVILSICQIKSDCDIETCKNVCEIFHMNGTCHGNECDCSSDKNCLDIVCDKVCGVVDLDGECDENNQCICKAELHFCSGEDWEKCNESCHEDSRAKGCLFVETVACLKYGPVLTCGCICWTWVEVTKSKQLSARYNLTLNQNQITKYHRTISKSNPRISSKLFTKSSIISTQNMTGQ